MGAAAACELARDGAKVALIDQSAVPNPRAASVDHSKVFRYAYPEAFYVNLAIDALTRWRELESKTGAHVLTATGALLLGRREPSFELDCYEAMRSVEVETEKLDSREATARFPQFNGNAFDYAIYDSSGAILHAETAVRALIDTVRSRVKIIEGERVAEVASKASRVMIATDQGNELECECAMISSGPWSRKLLPVLERELTTTRQEIVYFEPARQQGGMAFAAPRFPIFLELETGFYGFPIHRLGAMKIANHHKGSVVDPDGPEKPVDEQFIGRCRDFFSEFIPNLADARVVETRVCIYNNTRDDDFIIDWHPELDRVLIVTGFSGHGFKFGPTIGRIAADLILNGSTPFDIDRFSFARFNKTER
jgi:sarcosine oxidase